MEEYISRDAVLKFVADIQECKYEPDKIFLYCQHLKRIPAADVVPVVRCKDCKDRRAMDDLPDKWGRCRLFGTNAHDNDYCSYGTRMDKEATP